MKKFFIPIILLLVLFTVCCKKAATPAPATPVQNNDDYDAAHNVFRVVASSSGVSYSVTVKRFSAKNPTGDVQMQNQTSGAPFEEQIIPAVGDSIKVVAQTAKGSVYLTTRYKGIVAGTVNTQTTPSGGSISSVNYLVTN